MKVDVLRTFKADADGRGAVEMIIKEGKGVELPEHLNSAAEGLQRDGYIKIVGKLPAAAAAA